MDTQLDPTAPTARAGTTAAADVSSRERILREATRLFAHYGYDGTSLRMIAEAAELHKGSLVYHFETKEQIREAVLDLIIDRWKDVLPQIILTAATGVNRFERAIEECLRFFREDPNRAKFLMHESLSRPDDLQARIATRLTPWLQLLTDRIRQGQAEGRIYSDVDPLVYVWSIVLQVVAAHATTPLALGILGSEDVLNRIEAEIVRVAHRGLFIFRPKEGAL